MCKIELPDTIKMIITDFDGIVTDNCVYVGENREMTRKLNFKDVMGFALAKRNGYKLGIISGEKNSAIELISDRFNIEEVHQNIRIKIDVLKKILLDYGLSEQEYLYIGDDVNDIECLEYAKYKITVPNAVDKVKNVVDIQITQNSGGDGAFREVIDCLVG
ncbi:MAG: HAD hydrolase family protein [Candidatus Gastranaerophilales bacterium]